ncbi:MAG: hypothetical protein K9J27_13275 [Bacteroidales bacterium]|nr:hypothetical protein [Bacteroidales bacterium]
MKFFLSKVTIIAFVLALLFSGCEKSNQPVNENNEGISEEDLKTSEKIKSFLNKMEHPQKSDEVLSLDESVWNTEAGLNYSYGDAGTEIESVETDSCFVDVTLTDGGITMDDLSEVYSMIEDSVLSFYNTFSGQHHIVVSDVQLIETPQKSSSVTFKTTTAVSSNPTYPCTGFDEWDYWVWAASGGYCAGDSANVQSDSDAANEIEKQINKCKAVPAGDYYYTDVEEKELLYYEHPNPNDSNPDDNFFDYLVFENWEFLPNYHTCLSPQEMNFYLDGTETVIYNTPNDSPPGERPENKDFISVDLWGTLFPDLDATRIFHHGFIEYGILHASPPDPPQD